MNDVFRQAAQAVQGVGERFGQPGQREATQALIDFIEGVATGDNDKLRQSVPVFGLYGIDADLRDRLFDAADGLAPERLADLKVELTDLIHELTTRKAS